jgi:hypothetical protein
VAIAVTLFALECKIIDLCLSASLKAHEPIRPEDVAEMASYYRVDPKAEPHLLWIVRQV